MKILLDTHIILWLFQEPERIPESARSKLADLDNELWISPISIWEILILADRGRIILKPDAETWTRNILQKANFHEAPLSTEIAIRSRSLSLPHQDPADRFLAATSAVYDLRLMTMDENLIHSPDVETLD